MQVKLGRIHEWRSPVDSTTMLTDQQKLIFISSVCGHWVVAMADGGWMTRVNESVLFERLDKDDDDDDEEEEEEEEEQTWLLIAFSAVWI